jgi:ribosomal protein S27E
MATDQGARQNASRKTHKPKRVGSCMHGTLRTLKVPCTKCHNQALIFVHTTKKCVSRRTVLSRDRDTRSASSTAEKGLSLYDRSCHYDPGAFHPPVHPNNTTSQSPITGYNHFVAPLSRCHTTDVPTRAHPSRECNRLGVVDLNHNFRGILFGESPRLASDSDMYGDIIDRSWMANFFCAPR